MESEFKVNGGAGEVQLIIEVGSPVEFKTDIIWNRANDTATTEDQPAFDVSWSDFLYWFRHSQEFLELVELDKSAAV